MNLQVESRVRGALEMKFLCGCGDGTFMSSCDPNTGSLSSFSAPVN